MNSKYGSGDIKGCRWMAIHFDQSQLPQYGPVKTTALFLGEKPEAEEKVIVADLEEGVITVAPDLIVREEAWLAFPGYNTQRECIFLQGEEGEVKTCFQEFSDNIQSRMPAKKVVAVMATKAELLEVKIICGEGVIFKKEKKAI